MGEVPIKLKHKYTNRDSCKQQKSRTRTGPRCCNSGCGRRRSRAASKFLGTGRK